MIDLPDPALLLAGAAVLLSLLTLVVVLGQRGAAERLRLLAEQALGGQRAEAETTRRELSAVVARLGGDTAERIAASRGAMDTGIETIRTALSREQGELRLRIEEKLREMQEAGAARLAAIEKQVNEQLHAAVEKQMTESFSRVIDQFTAVQKAMADVQAVTAQIGDVKRLFSNVKTRGGWGETQVRAMLDDILPVGAYQANCKLRQGSDEMVEFAVVMPGRGQLRPMLAIDAKFPVEDYERLLAASEAGDPEAERLARRGLERRIRDEAKKIAKKYICPPETVDFAVLYLPTDALYSEVARVPGLTDEIGRECRVLVLGPSLFPALLRTIHLGFVTLDIEDKAAHVRDLLAATRTEMKKMDGVLEKLAKQAGAFGSTIEDARRRTRVLDGKLRSIGSLDSRQAEQVLQLEGAALAVEEA